MRLVVELRNDVIVRGTLDSADECMNMMLSGVSVQTLDGVRSSYDIMYLKGRNIRFLHLPKSLDPAQAILAQRQKIVDGRMAVLREHLRNPLERLAKGDGGAQHAGAAEEDDVAAALLACDSDSSK
ncbi:hypothetical protein FOA52_011684 [Chlamydomonas sp. UWO 241]|nr:hypothetical protein FOA52_011684 [Chlamydomonas sp. UWO 241]